MAGQRSQLSSPSILLIGATGRAGHEIVNQLIAHPSQPQLHLFCDKSTEVDDKHREACASVYQGDSSRATDVLGALQETEANIVILSIDNRNRDTTKPDICTGSAWAVVSAMKMPGMDHVRAIVLSSTGAGTSRIRVRRMSYGRLLEYRQRHVLRDHRGQESAFFRNALDDRTVIIRTTVLTDGKATGNVIEFSDTERAPSFRIDRVDVAMYVAKEVCSGLARGRIVNITSTI